MTRDRLFVGFVVGVLGLALACVAPGCGAHADPSPMARFAGTYRLDVDATRDAIERRMAASADPAEKERLRSVRTLIGVTSVRVRLDEDGSASTYAATLIDGEPQAGEDTGTWSVRGDRVTITSRALGDSGTSSGVCDGQTLELELSMGEGEDGAGEPHPKVRVVLHLVRKPA